MAIYTKIDEKALNGFLSAYDDIGEIISFSGIQSGVSNTNYELKTKSGHYVLTVFEPHRCYVDDVPYFLNYSDHLFAKGLPVPEVLRRTDGKRRSVIEGKPAALFTFLEGSAIAKPDIEDRHCAAVGKALGEMHLAVTDFDLFQENRFGLDKWKDWHKNLGSALNQIRSGLDDDIKRDMEYFSQRWPDHLPGGGIHADLFPDNVFFKDGILCGIIDFHFACSEFFAFDLAIAVNAWCFDSQNKYDPELYNALLEGYQSARELTVQERRAFPVLCHAASIRFLLSRAEEFLRTNEGTQITPHDPVDFVLRRDHFAADGYR